MQLSNTHGQRGKRQTSPVPTVSHVLEDKRLVEMVYLPAEKATAFAVWDGHDWCLAEKIEENGTELVPYSAENNLIKHDVVLLPSEPDDYGDTETLVEAIRSFIHRYVDVSPLFETVASYYVLLSWVYDKFNELPYLRLRGRYGSGKTRFLLTVGALCYKPVFASGASTVSPIFHILDAFDGTLILDEADFRFSDENTEIIKILNNGNVRGFPILRSELTHSKEFSPRAFDVFGPKIVATRSNYDDPGLESRFITEEMDGRALRDDIPINLTPAYLEEARALRNKLLLFRFRNYRNTSPSVEVETALEPRVRQIFTPLLSLVTNDEDRRAIVSLAYGFHHEVETDRAMSIEAQLLQLIRELWREDMTSLPIKRITEAFIERHGREYGFVNTRWIGAILRKRLRLFPVKSSGNFVLQPSHRKRLAQLYEQYGSTTSGDESYTEERFWRS